LEEERLHWLHGEGWTRRLAREGRAVQAALSVSFAQVAPDAISLFGIADDELIEEGVLSTGAETLRTRYKDRVNPILNTAGLPVLA
jgi:1,2-phenylacetyl-CoA epoxidase catalytic subunit